MNYMDHRTQSLADRVFERLEKDILTGAYARGEVLTEMALVENLGVSRTPIREALLRLEEEHLIEVSGRGVTVLGITNEDLLDIYAIRMRIEGMAAGMAAARRTEEELCELREALSLQEYYVTRADADHIKSQDSEFHRILYRLSGSRILAATLEPLHRKVQKYRKSSVQKGSRAEASLMEHKEIFLAIERGDSEAAERAMTAHVRNAAAHITTED